MKYRVNSEVINKKFIILTQIRQIAWAFRSALSLGRFLNLLRLGDRNKQIKRNAAELKGRPLVFGPWMGELGFEILYWAPFVNFLAKPGDIVISRGGVHSLYPSLLYYELFDHIDSLEWEKLQNLNYFYTGGEKQRIWLKHEIDLLRKILKPHNVNNFEFMHPSQLFNNLNLKDLNTKKIISERISEFSNKFNKSDYFREIAERSQEKNYDIFLAIYSREGLDKSTIDDFLSSEFFKNISLGKKICIIDNVYEDSHHSFSFDSQLLSNAISLKEEFSRNLFNKMDAIKSSKLVVTTDGGLAYLSLLLGVDTLAIRGIGNQWSNIHSSLAIELSVLQNAKYTLVKTDEKGNWNSFSEKSKEELNYDNRPE